MMINSSSFNNKKLNKKEVTMAFLFWEMRAWDVLTLCLQGFGHNMGNRNETRKTWGWLSQ